LLLTDITYQEACFYIKEQNGKGEKKKKKVNTELDFIEKECVIYFD